MTESDEQPEEEIATTTRGAVAVSSTCAAPPTLVAIATYNEILNLPSLIEEIARVVPQADLLVVDDNSPDGTGQWCAKREETDSRFHCLHRSGKLGLGTASIAAMRYAVEHDYKFLVTLDADWSHPPHQISQLLSVMESERGEPTDVAIGSRYTPGGAVQGWPWRRRQMSRAINAYARLALRLSVRDTSGAFRCYRVSQLRRLNLLELRSQGYSFYEEILWRLRRTGAHMIEIPITFTERQQGESKINLREAVKAVVTIARLGVSDRFGKR